VNIKSWKKQWFKRLLEDFVFGTCKNKFDVILIYATSVILIYFLKGLSGTKCNLNENYNSKTRNGKIVPG